MEFIIFNQKISLSESHIFQNNIRKTFLTLEQEYHQRLDEIYKNSNNIKDFIDSIFYPFGKSFYEESIAKIINNYIAQYKMFDISSDYILESYVDRYIPLAELTDKYVQQIHKIEEELGEKIAHREARKDSRSRFVGGVRHWWRNQRECASRRIKHGVWCCSWYF